MTCNVRHLNISAVLGKTSVPLPQSSTIAGKRTMAIKEKPKKIHPETIQVRAVQKVACVDIEGKETEGVVTVSS